MAEYYVCKYGCEVGGWYDNCAIWWNPNGAGYTTDLDHAGIYTDDDKARCYPDPKYNHYVPKELVDSASISTRIAHWHSSFGNMKKVR